MRILFPWSAIAASALATVVVARAHSGSDFLSVEDAALGHPGEGLLGVTYHLESYSGGDELSTELALSYTPLPRMSIGADIRFAEDANGDWVYSSVTPRLQFALTDPETPGRLRIGASIAYQFAEDISVQETVTTYEEIAVYREAPKSRRAVGAAGPAVDGGGGSAPDPGGGDGGSTDPPCNPLFDLDCDTGRKSTTAGRKPKHSGHTVITPIGGSGGVPSSASSGQGGSSGRGRIAETKTVPRKSRVTRGGGGHQGIHNHDARQWEARLIAECEFGGTMAVANLIATFPEDDHAYWGYGVGLRREILSDGFTVGVEAVGDFLAGGEHELVGTLGYRFTDALSVRAGAGIGLNDDSPESTFRMGAIWRF